KASASRTRSVSGPTRSCSGKLRAYWRRWSPLTGRSGLPSGKKIRQGRGGRPAFFRGFGYQGDPAPWPGKGRERGKPQPGGHTPGFVVSNRPGPAHLPGADRRRVRRALRTREPQQGVQLRPSDGPAERSSVRGQLLPAVPARGGDEPAGTAAAIHRGAVAAP